MPRSVGSTKEEVPKEIEEHLVVCDWLRKHGIFFIHIPNEGKRSIQQAVLLKHMGMQKGAPDFIIPGPTNIAIELKRCNKRSSRVSSDQTECIETLRKLGWVAEICYGAAQAIGLLQTLPLIKTPLKKIGVL